MYINELTCTVTVTFTFQFLIISVVFTQCYLMADIIRRIERGGTPASAFITYSLCICIMQLPVVIFVCRAWK